MRRLLPLLALLFVPVAPAQIVSIYGTFADPHISNLVNGSAGSVSTGYTATTTSHWSPGVGGGVTFGVLPIGPIRIGLDLRGSTKPGNDGADLVLFGPRIAIKLPFIRLKPYIQASGGYLRTRTTLINSPLPSGTQESSQFAAYEILGGLDYPLAHFVDFRVIELGGGQGYSAFGSSSAPDVSFFTVSTGIVLHF